MKIIEGFKMRKLGKDYIVVAESTRRVNFNKMIVFNATAAYLWESLADKEFTVDDIKQLLLSRYDVDEATAEADSNKVIQSWIDAGLVAQ